MEWLQVRGMLHDAAQALGIRQFQCGAANSPMATAGDSANDAFMSRTSSTGARPKKRLNSRLNCDALS
ncbi:hypothetical protein D3C72_2179230 [compost metagenome]